MAEAMRQDEDPDYDGPHECRDCGGTGSLMACPDDICRATGECRHDNGWRRCPRCDGNGEIPEGI